MCGLTSWRARKSPTDNWDAQSGASKNGKDRITDAEGKGDSVFLSVVFAAIATKTWNGFALASRLLDGAAELHRLMRNFTTARANGDSRDNSRHDDQPLHTLHGLLS